MLMCNSVKPTWLETKTSLVFGQQLSFSFLKWYVDETVSLDDDYQDGDDKLRPGEKVPSGTSQCIGKLNCYRHISVRLGPPIPCKMELKHLKTLIKRVLNVQNWHFSSNFAETTSRKLAFGHGLIR